MTTQRTLALLGSTGSIGTQAIDVVRAHPDRFTVQGICAHGSDVALLAEQAMALGVEVVGVARAELAPEVREAIAHLASQSGCSTPAPSVIAGEDAAAEVAALGADVVLNGMTGAIGLRPTLAALAAGSTLALANKESLIVGGALVMGAAAADQIVPVDSEHSAIAQCLRSGRSQEVRRLVLTASGGPFRGWSAQQLEDVTPEQALKHPNFSMGMVITTNSATLVNKGLEVIEAHHLFGVSYDQIDVVVHPQQQIHSMVEFRDGSTIAQMGPPRMLVPIGLGLSWPDRLDDVDVPCDWSAPMSWDFAPLDDAAFPAVSLARDAGRAGGTCPAVYNAANEVCVAAFHDGALSFPGIVRTVTRVLETHTRGGSAGNSAGSSMVDSVDSVDQVLAADAWARSEATSAMMDAQA
ncbi:MAG: 1-deoxy-D-xylulose-5-phosphate reductoisomerase [Ornithinimicrobium sp.]